MDELLVFFYIVPTYDINYTIVCVLDNKIRRAIHVEIFFFYQRHTFLVLPVLIYWSLNVICLVGYALSETVLWTWFLSNYRVAKSLTFVWSLILFKAYGMSWQSISSSSTICSEWRSLILVDWICEPQGTTTENNSKWWIETPSKSAFYLRLERIMQRGKWLWLK